MPCVARRSFESPSPSSSSFSSPFSSRSPRAAPGAPRPNRRRRYGSTRRDTPRPAYPPRAHSGAFATASTSSSPRASSSARVLASANARSPAEPYATNSSRRAYGGARISPPPPYAYRKVASFERVSSNACRTSRTCRSFVERVRLLKSEVPLLVAFVTRVPSNAKAFVRSFESSGEPGASDGTARSTNARVDRSAPLFLRRRAVSAGELGCGARYSATPTRANVAYSARMFPSMRRMWSPTRSDLLYRNPNGSDAPL